MNITKAQMTALMTIDENPGEVIAWNRTRNDYLRINGNVEQSLCSRGLIRTENNGDVNVWVLTGSGEAALGRRNDPVTAMQDAARAEGRRLGYTHRQIEEFVARMS